MSRPTCLVTGSGGFIGSHLCELLLAEGCRVVGTLRRTTPHIAHLIGQIDVHVCEITDRDRLRLIVSAARPEFVFHLAAQDVIQVSWEHPARTVEVNVLGTIAVLEAVREIRPDAVVQIAGSGAEYGLSEPKELPISESRVPRSMNPYALTKTAAVELGRLYAARYGMRVHSVRPFQFIGPRKYPDACSEFARGILAVERRRASDLPVGNLGAMRDLLDVRDGVQAMWRIARAGIAEDVYNICAGRGYVLRDILRMMVAQAGVTVTIREDAARLRPLDIPAIVGDNRKVRALGWEPEIPIERTLADILEYWRGISD